MRPRAAGPGRPGRQDAERNAEEAETMKIFLDTANVEQIREASALGVIDGVTTNPTLIAKEGRDF